jgi:cell migration-inducing and hyaluronan-binding protein
MRAVRSSLILLIFLLVNHYIYAEIKGYVGPVKLIGNTFYMTGWTCDTKINKSIPLHIYIEDDRGQRSFLKAARTTVSSEQAIHNICKTKGEIKHRFMVPLTNQDLIKHGGKKLRIFGISQRRGRNNELIHTHNQKKIIPINESIVRGHIDTVNFPSEDNVVIMGWACHKGFSQSTKIHIYAEDNDGVRTFVGVYNANSPSGAGVKKACRSNGNHRFRAIIPKSRFKPFLSEKILVFGIKVADGVNNNRLTSKQDHFFPATVTEKLSEVAKNGKDLNIHMGQKIVIDKSMNLGQIKILGGILTCPDNKNAYEIKTSGIMIKGNTGQLICGTSSKRFYGKLTIKLKKGTPLGRMGDAAIGVMDGGRLIIHGSGQGSKWVRLAQHAKSKDTKIVVNEATGWRKGDHIAIGPTGFNLWQAEKHKIRNVSSDGRTIYLETPLRSFHYGKMQYFKKDSSKTFSFDSRAEVINLTRNIKITTDGNTKYLDTSRIGGHIMIMKGAYGYVDSVELDRMGQMGEMGRYPFHWHRAKNVNGQYIRNSSIVNSYQRCVTIHGTSYARVINNVCYNHFGHGYFLEDGNETKNYLIGNVGMLSKRTPKSRALLISDHTGTQPVRFEAPATYWISNPDNHIVNNVASGSQGTGFWMSFVPYLFCDDNSCEVVSKAADANVFPSYQSTLKFDGNISHSSKVGFTWDGAAHGALTNNPNNEHDRRTESSHYHNKGHDNPNGKMPQFNNLTTYKNIHSAIYYRGNTSIFNNFKSADSTVNLFIAFNQHFKNSLIVGESDNSSAAERDFRIWHTAWSRKRPVGMVTYDGPVVLNDVHFAKFSDKKIIHRGRDITPAGFHLFGGASHYENQLVKVSFEGRPYYKVLFSEDGVQWQDAKNHVRMRDVNGTLYGKQNELIVPNHPILTDSSCRKLEGNRTQALGCDYTLGNIHHGWTKNRDGSRANVVDFYAVRNDGKRTANYNPDRYRLNNKLGVILNKGYIYNMFYNMNNVSRPGLMFEAKNRGDISPILRFPANSSCTPGGRFKRLASLNALKSYNGDQNAIYVDSNNIVHLRAVTRHYRSVVISFQSDAFVLNCP